VRTTSFIRLPPWPARLGQRDAERLEDGLEHVLRVASFDQTDVQCQSSGLGELVEEARSEVAGQPCDPRLRQVHVRDEQRAARRLQDDVRERLVHRYHPGTVASYAFGTKRLRERFTQRTAGRRDLDLGAAGLDIEREIERRRGREQRQQVVEHRHTRADVRLPPSRDVYARTCAPLSRRSHDDGGYSGWPSRAQNPRRQWSTRSICAPSVRRRSSIRS
jgi:hypothetical protein